MNLDNQTYAGKPAPNAAPNPAQIFPFVTLPQHFDPCILETFLRAAADFEEIFASQQDEPAS